MTISKKYLIGYTFLLILFNSNYSYVFASDVRFEENKTIEVREINLIVLAGSTAETFTINTSNIFVVTGAFDSVTLVSYDKYQINSSPSIALTCTSTQTSITIPANQAVVIVPTAVQANCSDPNAPDAPSIISVDDFTTFPTHITTRKPSIISSAYYNTGNSQHLYSDWEIYSDPNLTRLFAFIHKSNEYLTEVKFGKSAFSFSNKALDRLGLGFSYWIRIRYINAQGLQSSWSQPVQIIAHNSLPAVPSIISPENGQKIAVSQPTIIWTLSGDDDNVSQEIRYILCVNSIQNSINCKLLFFAPTGANSFKIPIDLGLDSLYYIAIKALDNDGGSSSYSPFNAFTTASSYPTQYSLLSGAGYASILNTKESRSKIHKVLPRKRFPTSSKRIKK